MTRHNLYKILVLMSIFALYLFNISNTYTFIDKFKILIKREYFNDVDQQLLDLKDFKYLINPLACGDCSDGVQLVFVIFSALNNTKRRSTIRETWSSWEKRINCAKQVFLLGTVNDDSINKAINMESNIHADIVQGNFIDTYRNLTYKHVMGLKWVTRYCRNAQYMIKADDDVTISPEMFRLTIESNNKRDTTDYMACNVVLNSTVRRKNNKWAVRKDEYPDDKYPTYCDGPVIIYSTDVVRRLLEESTRVPFFWIDDVYITGLLAKSIGVKPQEFKTYWIFFNEDVFVLDDLQKKMAKNNSVTADPHLLYRIWKSRAENNITEHSRLISKIWKSNIDIP